ncbi:RND family efflux transporter, MFP subunit [Alteromonadaceae bacterium Bs31]|nr:RND family efflux transporter, MFP subunit [Alteromonadaceae bacterium Bs31]
MRKSFALPLLLFALVSACSEEESSVSGAESLRPAKIILAVAAGEKSRRIFPGTIESAVQSELAFRVGGQLEKLPAVPGTVFKTGALLAELDDSEYQNTLKDRQAKYSLAKSQYEKIIQLSQQNHVSPTKVDEAEAGLKEAQAALSVAEDNLKHTRLLAPFDGVVANLRTENHQVVNPHETILQLRAEDQLDVRFNIPESLLGKLKHIDDPSDVCVQVRFNVYPAKAYPACFKEFESTPDRLTRTYSVVHRMPPIREFTALPGMAVEVDLDLSELLREKFTQGVLIPLSAVFEEGGQSFVWRVDANGNVQKRPVEIGGIQDEKMLVTSGLEPNEALVSVGVSYIHEGMRVRPITKERGI